MNNGIIKKSTLVFLKNLAAHNDREWFQEHKVQYEQAKENAEQFMERLLMKMNQHDQLEPVSGKKSLYRIYNDVRFAKEKSPYNPRFAGYLKRVKPFLRGGYYIWIKLGGSHVGCGFSYPNADDLKRIRQDISLNHKEWLRLLKSKAIKENFGVMQGERVKTVPRGFEADDPAIELLRHKQFWFDRNFTDQEVVSPEFLSMVNKTFKSIRPLFDYMSDVLTTNVNGEPL